ncbi:glutathione S-transferase [Shewanella sp. SP2S2-4]|uniref:glutathione S-transferase n=1 Tax=Shewanella sp. SP2S2-4 TaxID=3063539 RepID=UPI002892300E|nr:glutathione S-transferase [Shewanella sp. SP2S2-4]MDT3272772.1 glutathione S-transferase [Shewanella sp. SP2S2-4]
MALAVLYTFRRCPYAIRARLGLLLAQCNVEVREITLKAKPAQMLAASPKGTVPVLVLANGEVIAESLEIMRWALTQADPLDLLCQQSPVIEDKMAQLITQNDQQFKPWLDRYKYADRYPEQTQADYYQQASHFLTQLEACLGQHSFLVADTPRLADYAIVPFIRQFAAVDLKRALSDDFPRLAAWLENLISSEIFIRAMEKYVIWDASHSPTCLLGDM